MNVTLVDRKKVILFPECVRRISDSLSRVRKAYKHCVGPTLTCKHSPTRMTASALPQP